MKALPTFTLTAVALAMAGTVSAQRIEISSASIGTVVVTPPAVNDSGARPTARTNARGRTGVDLGIKRRADGSLYDPLDPAQNPNAGVPFGNASTAGTASGLSSYNLAGTGASNVDSNPGAANALSGSSNGGLTNPGSAAGATAGGSAAGASSGGRAGSGR